MTHSENYKKDTFKLQSVHSTMVRSRKRQKKKKTKRRQRGGLLPGLGVGKGVTHLAGRFVKNKGAKKALTEGLGPKLKRAWNNLTGKNRPKYSMAYNMKKGKLPKKPKGCKVLTESRNAKGQVVSYGCWR